MADGDPIASGGSEPVTSAPDLITAIAAVTDATDLATVKADAAETAAEDAAESLFQIKQSWYGSLAGDPALDPNNNSPMNGALYYNTVMDRLMTYNGTGWVAVVGIFLSGSAAPGAGDGANGDFYVQMPAGTLYGPKAGGVWPAGIAIAGVGPAPWTAPSDWAASQSYTVGPPASLVVYNGEAYVCTTTHTSGGSFDASKWVKVTASAAIPSTSITDSTAAGRALLTAASAAAQRTALGLGTAGLLTAGATGEALVEAATAGDARTALGLGTLATTNQVPISAAPAGTWVLLNTLTAANSAALSDTTNFTAAYDEYEIVLEDIRPATNNVDLRMQVRSGEAWKSSSYKTTTSGSFGGSFSYSNPTAHIEITNLGRTGSASGHGVSGRIGISAVNSSAYKKVWGQVTWFDGTYNTVNTTWPSGFWDGGTGAVTGVLFYMSTGNIASGKIYIYGRKK